MMIIDNDVGVDEQSSIERRRSAACELIDALSTLPALASEVLWRSINGETVDATAARTGLSRRTVQRYRSRALRALKVRTLTEAGLLIGRAGLVPKVTPSSSQQPSNKAA